MAARGKSHKRKTNAEDESRIYELMFAEYREENARDLEREGLSNW